MPSKTKSPATKKKDGAKAQKEQSERFIEAARKLGVDETGKEFEALFEKIVPPKRLR